MKKSKFTEKQIAYDVRQVESGTPPADADYRRASAGKTRMSCPSATFTEKSLP